MFKQTISDYPTDVVETVKESVARIMLMEGEAGSPTVEARRAYVVTFFRINVIFNNNVSYASYSIATIDGTSFHYLDALTIPFFRYRIWDIGGIFSSANKSMVQEAIKRYIGDL